MSLRFRRETTYNSHDSRQIASDSGRVTIANGVKHRCELVLNSLLRLGSGNTTDVLTHLQARFNDSYSRTDVSTAVEKLRSGGVIFRRGRGRAAKFYPSRDALIKWREIPKESV